MLLINQFIGNDTLISAIRSLGLTANLKLCLDAADPASYTSGQSWLDTSGNGYDFFLGADGSATASDPTFVGPVGSQGAYWSFDGNNYFTYDTTNETWMQNLHKNNAVLTIVGFYRQASQTTDRMQFLGDTGSGGTGIEFYIASSAKLTCNVRNGASEELSATSDSALGLSAWHMVGISLTEATGVGGGFLYVDGDYAQVGASNTFNATYASPSSGNALSTMQLAALGGSALPSASGQRLACLAVWSSALTKANLDSVWAAMRGRFGL
ncbi:MAG: LamG-like jellyroll fold domain-containing protein [Armatimonadota bacterium]|nr:LamG-like jellyroll fold domain-containing protein [Armatimonadota bacterium]